MSSLTPVHTRSTAGTGRKPRVQSSSSSTRTFFPPLLCSLSPPPCRLSLLPIRLVSCNESAVYTPHARTHTHRTRVGGRKRRKKHRQRTVEKSPWKATTITRVATWWVIEWSLPSSFFLSSFFFTSFSNNFLMGKEKYNSCFISCLWNTKILH